MGITSVVDGERRSLDDAERRRLGGTYVRLTNGVTHYRLQGPPTGPMVVLVHGGTIPMWTWDRQVPALIAAGHRVLTYDAFGRGYSDRPAVVYDRHLYRSQLRELVDSLGIAGPFDLIGVSMGGATAVSFTAAYPQRVRRLVLISPVVRDYSVPRMFQVPILGEVAARVYGLRVLVQRSQAFFADSPNPDHYKVLMHEQMSYRGFTASVLSMLRNDGLGDYTAEYRAVGQQDRPVLLLWGTGNSEVTRSMIDIVRTEIPNSVFRPIEESGHGILFQQPELINHQLLEFLGGDKPEPL
jgi:pimeloyl-ACP methyl ester carboxylesterase